MRRLWRCWRCPAVKYDPPGESYASSSPGAVPVLLQKDDTADAALVRVRCGDWLFSTSDSPSCHTPLDSTHNHSVSSLHDDMNAELAVGDSGSCVDGPEDHDVAVQLIHKTAACTCCKPVLDHRFFVPFDELCFNKMIGKGSFKTVYRGRWRNTSVAIVRMRTGGMVTEARLMQQLSSHPNLVQFYRWSEDSQGNEYVVLELVALGSLDRVLLHLQDLLRVHVKLSMCEQICAGMAELAQEGVLHRDLAARNVLVQSVDPVHVKVADFGLARGEQGSSPTLLGSISVRWAAPEVLLRQEWSPASDVWAFGVTAWEIFSNGSEPYAAQSDKEVLEAVLSGQRLARPPRCPREMYALMLKCWASDPAERPTFDAILATFKNWQRQRHRQMEALQQHPVQSSLGPQDLLASVHYWATQQAAAANTQVLGGPEALQRQPGQLARAVSCEPEHLLRASLEQLAVPEEACNTAALSSGGCCRCCGHGHAADLSSGGAAICAGGFSKCRQHDSALLLAHRASHLPVQLQLQRARNRHSCSAPLPWYSINKHVEVLAQQGLVSAVLGCQQGVPSELHKGDTAASSGCARSCTIVPFTGDSLGQGCCTRTSQAPLACIEQGAAAAASVFAAQKAAQLSCPLMVCGDPDVSSSAQLLAQPGALQREAWVPAESCEDTWSMTRGGGWRTHHLGLQPHCTVLFQQQQHQHQRNLSSVGSTVDAGTVQELQDSSDACSIDLSFCQEEEIDPDDISGASLGSPCCSLLNWSDGQDGGTLQEQLCRANEVQLLPTAVGALTAGASGERVASAAEQGDKAQVCPADLPHCSVPAHSHTTASSASWRTTQDQASGGALHPTQQTPSASACPARHSPYVNVRSIVYGCRNTGGPSYVI